MRKLSEIKNEDALDLLADIIEPCSIIFSDKEIKKQFQEKKTGIKIVSYAIKQHKKEVLEIMARLENVPLEEYECNFLTLPVRILSILNDTEIMDFFVSQGQEMAKESSGSHMENIKVVEK